MTTREDAIAACSATRDRALALAGRLSEGDWQRPVYDGWAVRDVFAHLASTAAYPAFFLGVAERGYAAMGAGAGFDNDAFNARQVAERAGRSPHELVAEFSSGRQAGIAALEAAADDLLQRRMPDFVGGMSPVVDVIAGAGRGHETEHLDDIERALGAA